MIAQARLRGVRREVVWLGRQGHVPGQGGIRPEQAMVQGVATPAPGGRGLLEFRLQPVRIPAKAGTPTKDPARCANPHA